MNQAKPMSADQLGQAFDMFNRVSHELDTSYRELESQVAALTYELSKVRSARLLELAEKERLANRLTSLISALPGGVLIVDSTETIRDANPEAIELLGEPLIRRRWVEVLDRISGKNQDFSRAMRLRSGRRISVVSRPLDATGDQVVLITDVSEIHQLQEQLGQKKRLVAMGEMAARMAHQIRTPLSSATLFMAQLGRQDLSASRQKRVSHKVADCLGQMDKLVDSMLSFVRGDKPIVEFIYLKDVLADFELAVKPLLEKNLSSISMPVLDDSLAVKGDRGELASALGNLVMNALEAAKTGVKLDVWVGALDSKRLQIRVRDDGPGIDEEIIDRVFDPFFTTRALGTGLGLAVVAMTISKHCGEIAVKNRPEGGAEFIITLPIADRSEGGVE